MVCSGLLRYGLMDGHLDGLIDGLFGWLDGMDRTLIPDFFWTLKAYSRKGLLARHRPYRMVPSVGLNIHSIEELSLGLIPLGMS